MNWRSWMSSMVCVVCGHEGELAWGSLPRLAARCVEACKCGARAGGSGHVLRPSLAGHPMECTSVSRSSAEFSPEGPGHRESGLRPYPKPPAPGTEEVGEDVARQLGCRRAVVVPPGAGPIRGVPASVLGTGGADAAERCGARWCPASVGRRTGAPPPPCRHDAGRQRLRGQTVLGRKRASPGTLALFVCAGRRVARLGH